MKYKNYLRFNSPNKVDWIETEDAIIVDVVKNHPSMRLANRALLVAEIVVELRKLVNEKGTRALWDELGK